MGEELGRASRPCSEVIALAQINQEWVTTVVQGRVFEESRVDTFLMRFRLGDPRPEDVYALASFILHIILVFGSFWLFIKGLRQKNLGVFWRWRKGIGELDIEVNCAASRA